MPIRIALVAPGAVPAVQGGAENLWAGLIESFNQLPGVRSDFISPSSPETNLMEVLQGYQRFGELDLKGYDRVVTTKYPAWACSHPNHVVYLQHTLRGLYDTYPAHLGLWLSVHQAQAIAQATQETKALARVGPLLCRALEAASAPSWQFGARAQAVRWAQSITSSTATLAGLLIQLLKALEDSHQHWAADYPGPFARACVRLLDAMALAPSRIKHYFAISQTVAERQDYFPLGVQVGVRHHPTALEFNCHSNSTNQAGIKTEPVANTLLGDQHSASGASLRRDILLAPSRLEPAKRIDMIIRGYAASGVKTPLWVVGTGPQESELQALAAQTPGVEMKGFLNDHALAQAYQRSQFVVFAPQQEDYGLVTVEAFKAATPVLTCADSGGPTELVVHEQTGYLAQPSVEGLAEGFSYLSALAESGRKAMGEQARAWVQENLNWVSLAHELSGDSKAFGVDTSRWSQSLPQSAHAHGVPPRMLVLNTFPIEPVTSGGRQRMLGLYKGLSSHFDVQLISLSTPDSLSTLRQHAPYFTELRLPVSKSLQDRARYYEGLLGVSCFDLTVAQHPELLFEHACFLQSAIEASTAVVFSHPYCFPLFEALGFEASPFNTPNAKPIVYEAHNVESQLKPPMLPQTRLGEQFSHLVRSLELRLLRQATSVIACAPDDQTFFQNQLIKEGQSLTHSAEGPSVILAPNGLETSQARFKSWASRLRQAKSQGYKLALFIGSDHGPNVQAANIILDALEHTDEDWHFVILGSCCHSLSTDRLKKNALKRLKLVGLATELEKSMWFDRATVGLNPMGLGSGSNLKVAEYVANGLGVISTEFGTRGWNWQPNCDYLIIEPEPLSLSNALHRFEGWSSERGEWGEPGVSKDWLLSLQAQSLNWDTIGRRLGVSLLKRLAFT